MVLNVIRIVMIGSSRVGKTALIQQFINKTVSKTYQPTHNLQTYRKLIEIHRAKKSYVMIIIDDLFAINHPWINQNGETSKEMIRIIDCIIQNKRLKEKKRRENPVFAQQPINCLFFVFDLSRQQSLVDLEKILEIISKKEEQRQNRRKTVKFLIGNKKDLYQDAVSTARIQIVVKRYRMEYFKVSAFSRGVEKIFEKAAQSAPLHEESSEEEQGPLLELPVEVRPNLLDWCNCTRRNGRCVIQ